MSLQLSFNHWILEQKRKFYFVASATPVPSQIEEMIMLYFYVNHNPAQQ